VNRDAQTATELGAFATPTFFIGTCAWTVRRR